MGNVVIQKLNVFVELDVLVWMNDPEKGMWIVTGNSAGGVHGNLLGLQRINSSEFVNIDGKASYFDTIVAAHVGVINATGAFVPL